MRILLVGEFSSFHRNLKAGLTELGHQVTVVSSGDGWKKVETDIQLPSARDPITGKRSIKALLTKIWFELKLSFTLRNYDVVQFVNPLIFTNIFGLNQWIIRRLIANNKRSFLLAAGDDSFYWHDFSSRFRYSTHTAEQAQVDSYKIWLKPATIQWNQRLADLVDGIIPIMYEYQSGYIGHKNLCKVIPIPIPIDDHWLPNVVGDKVKIYFPANNERAAFKGNEHILPALEQLKTTLPDEVEIVISDRVSYAELMHNIDSANIVIDQTNSYSYGVSGALVLSRGRVLLSGAEPESLRAFGIESSPVVNILPHSEHILQTLLDLVQNKMQLQDMGAISRQYSVQMHHQQKVAAAFISQWQVNAGQS